MSKYFENIGILLFNMFISLSYVKLAFYALNKLSILYLIILLKPHGVFIIKVLMTFFNLDDRL